MAPDNKKIGRDGGVAIGDARGDSVPARSRKNVLGVVGGGKCGSRRAVAEVERVLEDVAKVRIGGGEGERVSLIDERSGGGSSEGGDDRRRIRSCQGCDLVCGKRAIVDAHIVKVARQRRSASAKCPQAHRAV